MIFRFIACVVVTCILSCGGQYARALPQACIICEQGPTAANLQEWANQKHKTTQLVNAEGKPLAGVRVSLQSMPEPLTSASLETTATYTHGPGLFSYRADSESTQLLVFSKAGYASVAHRAAETLPRQITLPVESILTGTVVMPDGSPVPHAHIGPLEVRDPAEDHGVSGPPPVFPFINGETDDNGGFEFRALQQVEYRIRVHASGAGSSVLRARPGGDVRIVLPSDPTTVTGHLLGSRGRNPLPGELVEARTGELKEYARTDSSGTFNFSGLARDTWTFRAHAPANRLMHPAVTVDLSKPTSSPVIALVYNEGISLAGEIVDAETSLPITHMPLIIEEPVPQRAETDRSGHFTFEKLNGLAEIPIRYDMEHFAFLAEGRIADRIRVSPAPDADLTSLTIPLYRCAQIRGIVTGPDGTPAIAADVVVRRITSGTSEMNMAKGITKETASDGSFSCGMFPSGKFEISSNAPGALAQPVVIDAITTAPNIVNLRLVPTTETRGIVQDAQGHPVAGAVVSSLDEFGTAMVNSVTSDNAGKFSIPVLRVQSPLITAQHPHFAAMAKSIVDLVTATSSGVALQFPAGKKFVAFATTTDGTPVANANVEVEQADTTGLWKAQGVTAADGIVTLSLLDIRQISHIKVSSNSHVPLEATDLALNGTTFTAALISYGTIVCRAQTEQTSDAANMVYLYRKSAAAAYSYVSHARMGRVGTRFDQLTPGWYKAGLVNGSRYVECNPVELKPGREEWLYLSPRSDVTLDGKILDKLTGQPIAAAIITLQPQQSQIADLPPRQIISGADGTFSFSDLGACDSIIQVRHPNYPEWRRHLQVRPPSLYLEVPLSSQMVRVHGRIDYAGTPVANALIVLTSQLDPETPYLSAMSASDGTYRFPGVTPGEYFVITEAPVSEDEHVGHRTTPLVLVESEPDKQLDMSFACPVQVRGHVNRSNAESVAPAELEHVLFVPEFAGGVTQTASVRGGEFQIALEPGRYRAIVADESTQQVEIPSTDNRIFELKLRR